MNRELHIAGLELLLAAVHSDDPKREILVRVGDAIREAKQSDWRLIETAPKDGTRILVCSDHPTDRPEVAAHTTVKNFKGGHPWREGHSLGRITWNAPSHWMPLPDHPATSTST